MIDYTDPAKITPEGRARLDKYGSTLDADNVQSVIERIADYPEIIEAVDRLRLGLPQRDTRVTPPESGHTEGGA